MPNFSLLGNRWLFSLSGVRQCLGGSQIVEGSQIAALRVPANFSGRVDIELAALLFEMHALATFPQEGADVLQGWFGTICLLLEKLRVERAGSHGFRVSLSQRLYLDLQGLFSK